MKIELDIPKSAVSFLKKMSKTWSKNNPKDYPTDVPLEDVAAFVFNEGFVLMRDAQLSIKERFKRVAKRF